MSRSFPVQLTVDALRSMDRLMLMVTSGSKAAFISWEGMRDSEPKEECHLNTIFSWRHHLSTLVNVGQQYLSMPRPPDRISLDVAAEGLHALACSTSIQIRHSLAFSLH